MGFLQPSTAQRVGNPEAIQSLFDMTRQQDEEALWASLYRLRAAEDRLHTEGQIGSIYSQLRAQKEAELGNHATALRYWDSTRPPRDAAGTLPAGTRSVDALAYLTAVGDTAQVIMINERHHAAPDRLLTLELLAPLYERGFRYLAAEAFTATDSALAGRGYPLSGVTGSYIEEPVFGAVVRTALRLGYTLVPYEHSGRATDDGDGLTRQQRRDRGQARNLRDRIFQQHPDAKVLVHAGFGHVEEVVSPRFYPMAVYFTEMTGIDPVTVVQTTLSERSIPAHEHPLYRAARRAGLVQTGPVILRTHSTPMTPVDVETDLQVLTPRTTYAAGRPAWMALGGRRTPTEVSVAECAQRTCVVEVRVPGEAADAAPLDRVEVDRESTAWLFLPPDRTVDIVTKAVDGAVLETWPSE